jgi:hypothetical protein
VNDFALLLCPFLSFSELGGELSLDGQEQNKTQELSEKHRSGLIQGLITCMYGWKNYL